MTTTRTLICDYCGKPAGSPVARLAPGDKTTPLVEGSHWDCWDRFLTEALVLDRAKAEAAK